uniref:BAR domain-containing protein n=3 Tax=Wuchereria bancrofti TaxID=6293 RepID=A0AAF5PWM4_WUCBA
MPKSSIFDRMFQKLKIQRSRETKYPAELVSMMELLPTMHDVADELMTCSDAISRRFQLKDETTTASEKLALSIKLLTPKVAEHKEYANFLKAQSEMYDIIGNMQRTMYTEIQDRVTNQLKTWVLSDYQRIINSIELLKEKRCQMDMVTMEVEKSVSKDEKTETAQSFRMEQSRKDYEMQLALVKADLRKIPAILIDQATCLKHFNELMTDYHKQMEEVLQKFGAGKV